MRHWLKCIHAIALILALAGLGGCLSRVPRPAPFEQPLESRLILQMPYYSDARGAGGPAALAEVMTYNGRPRTVEDVDQALGRGGTPSIHEMVVLARREALKAEYRNGTPEELVAAVRQSRPVIVRLGLDVPPMKKGDYIVVVGYTPEGPVLNSGATHQQILPWAGFLTGWYQGGNVFIMIEPL